MKRIITVQDISCVGKCSLTVALPIISAMGIEACVLPTAVLSSHTSFPDFTFRDLTNDIEPICECWKKAEIDFDGIYTGYLGTKEQIDLIIDLIDTYNKKDSIVFVDPAMADNGKMYAGFRDDFASDMARLCSKADIITPNLTEACFMLGIEYIGNQYTREQVQTILKELSKLGCKKVILTGISFDEEQLGAMAYDSVSKKYVYYTNQKVSNNYHGTGDIFASACFGALVRGMAFGDALRIAVDFALEAIMKTEEDSNRRWYGVNFEEALPMLIQRIQV